MYPIAAWVISVGVVGATAFLFAWRWASRLYNLPCPASFAWALESGIYGRLTGTDITLTRIGLKPGQRVLELGPGPGRLLIPAAHAVQPDGEAVGIEI